VSTTDREPAQAQWARALAEAGIADDEIPGALSALDALALWSVDEPSPQETRHLVAALAPSLRGHSSDRATGRIADLLAAARAQAMVLTPAFWIASAIVMALGVTLASLGFGGTGSAALYLVGPLLSYLGTSMGFRAVGLGTLELELAGPITARQLALARLVLIVGYQLVVGLILSLPLWSGSLGAAGVILGWLAPLLMATGLTLALSLWMKVETAAVFIYALWTATIVLAYRFHSQDVVLGRSVEEVLAVAGLILLGLVVATAPSQVVRLPRRGSQPA
jgi:hypothetical protein